MVEDLEEPWEELCRSIEQRQRDLIDLIIRITDTAINDFGKFEPFIQRALLNLGYSCRSRRQLR